MFMECCAVRLRTELSAEQFKTILELIRDNKSEDFL